MIRRRREDIVACWQQSARALPHARALDAPRLIDHIPELLDRIAYVTEEMGRGRTPELARGAAERHALARLEEGFDILEVIAEFRALREVMFDLLEDVSTVPMKELRVLNAAIDAAISESVDRYADVRERTLQGFDRIATAAMASTSLDDLLMRLLRVLHETTPAIDTSSIYLREGDILRARAVVGMGRETEHGRTIRVGEGFAGTIAERREPMTIHRPGPAELVDPTLAYAGIRALWGVPIVDDGVVIGVAKIASLTADEFSMQDQRIFKAMVARATSAIVQHALREQAQRTEQGRRFLDHATRALTRSLDHHETLEQIAHLAVPELADWCIVDLVDEGRIEHVAVVHADAAKRELANTYLQTHAAHIDAGTQRTLSTGRVQHAFDITDEMLAAVGVPCELGFRSWIGAPLVGFGAPLGVIHLIMSDSGRRHTDSDVEVAAELGQRAGIAVANARLYRNAQEAVRLRDNVLAIVSHDLRNPLGAIDLGATLLLQQFGADTRARKHLEMVRRSAGHMEALINDLLDMASINAKKLTLAPAAIDVGELLGEALDIQEPVARERGIRIMRNNELAGVVVHADRNRLLQVLGNLLGNALKFCRPGDVVFARGELEDGNVRLVVADTGPGISHDDIPHIFDPYWSGRTTANKGTGLGLYITKAIVDAHRGSIAVSSDAGKGAEFTVTLPVA